jgi:flagellin-like hook-associated protein FlgL
LVLETKQVHTNFNTPVTMDAPNAYSGLTAAEQLAEKIQQLMLALASEENDTNELKRELEETTQRLNEILNRSEGRP